MAEQRDSTSCVICSSYSSFGHLFRRSDCTWNVYAKPTYYTSAINTVRSYWYLPTTAAEVLSLKELSRLQLLRSLGRESYSRIPFLPLPSHLQQYVSFYRDWGDPIAPIKTLCPMEDQTDDGEEGENSDNSKRKRRRQRKELLEGGAEAMMMLQREINRRRVALVNINGLVFQVCAF